MADTIEFAKRTLHFVSPTAAGHALDIETSTATLKLRNVMPAKAGIQKTFTSAQNLWIPAFAGMTES